MGRPKKSLKERKIKLWYVLAVDSGMDTRVRRDITRQAKIDEIKEIGRVIVPRCAQEVWKQSENDGGGAFVKQNRMMFPGYVLIKCKYSDEVFHLIRSTKGARGLLMDDKNPTPMTNYEAALVFLAEKIKPKKFYPPTVQPKPKVIECKYTIGESIRVESGNWLGFEGTVTKTDGEDVTVTLTIMGRDIPVKFKQDELRAK